MAPLPFFRLYFMLSAALTSTFTTTDHELGNASNNTDTPQSTSDPPQTTQFSTTATANDDIECGETRSGTIGDAPDSVTLIFVNEEELDVTITDCDTAFDPKLHLIDSDGTYIQNQSTNECDGDDCDDSDFCTISHRETFTMQSLEEGTYSIELTPYSSGGDWTVKVFCSPPTTTDSPTRPPTHSPTVDGCIPSVETLNFYEETMNGVWLYDEEKDYFRLNISGTTGYYKLYQPIGWWRLQEIDIDGHATQSDGRDYLLYCKEGDLSECAGSWNVFDEYLSWWVVDSKATSQLIDCVPTQCDVIGFTADQTDC